MALDMKWNGLRWTDFAISLLALALVLYFIDPGRLVGLLLHADPAWVLLGAFAYSMTMVAMAWRLRYILRFLGEKLELARAYWVNAAGLLASDLTPARSGYFVVPFLFERHDCVALEKGMVAILSPQIVDFFLKAVVAGLGIFFILALQPSLRSESLLLFAGAGAMAAFSLAMAILLFVPRALDLDKPFLSIPIVRKVDSFIRLLQANRARVLPIFPVIVLCSLFNFMLKGIEWYCLGQALGVQFNTDLHPLVIFLMLQPLISALQFIPIPTMAGLGLAEGGAAASMVLLGVPAELAIAFLLLTRAVTMLLDGLGVWELGTILHKKTGTE